MPFRFLRRAGWPRTGHSRSRSSRRFSNSLQASGSCERLEDRLVLTPNLTHSLLTVIPSNQANAGDTITVDWQIENNGTTNAGNFGVEFLLSETESFDPGAVPLHVVDVNGLNAGAQDRQQTDIVLPERQATHGNGLPIWSKGDSRYYIIMNIDFRGDVAESKRPESGQSTGDAHRCWQHG